MSLEKPLQRVCIAGIGGFAAAHHESLRELEQLGKLRVVATCDPRALELQKLRETFNFEARNTRVFDNFCEMLDTAKPAWASVATPITTHASMHRACMERSVACYLEKPPTLDPVELDQMIELDRSAARHTQVGFNYVYEPERLLLKRRILAGEFGRVQRIGLRCAWRRTEGYYSRSPWAGRLIFDNALLLDSCLGNAMSHHVHNVLFLAGVDGFHSWGSCSNVEAALFRVNPIEGADTIFLRGHFSSSIEFRMALTHACEDAYTTEESIICEKAAIQITPFSHMTISHLSGSIETIPICVRAHLRENFRIFGEYVQGEPHELLSTLADCRPFVHLNAMAYLSSGQITTIAPSQSQFIHSSTGGGSYWRIPGIENQLEEFVETGDFAAVQSFCHRSINPQIVYSHTLPLLREQVASICRERLSSVKSSNLS